MSEIEQDQLVADERRCSVNKAKKLRFKNPIEYNRTILWAEAREQAKKENDKTNNGVSK